MTADDVAKTDQGGALADAKANAMFDQAYTKYLRAQKAVPGDWYGVITPELRQQFPPPPSVYKEAGLNAPEIPNNLLDTFKAQFGAEAVEKVLKSAGVITPEVETTNNVQMSQKALAKEAELAALDTRLAEVNKSLERLQSSNKTASVKSSLVAQLEQRKREIEDLRVLHQAELDELRGTTPMRKKAQPEDEESKAPESKDEEAEEPKKPAAESTEDGDDVDESTGKITGDESEDSKAEDEDSDKPDFGGDSTGDSEGAEEGAEDEGNFEQEVLKALDGVDEIADTLRSLVGDDEELGEEPGMGSDLGGDLGLDDADAGLHGEDSMSMGNETGGFEGGPTDPAGAKGEFPEEAPSGPVTDDGPDAFDEVSMSAPVGEDEFPDLGSELPMYLSADKGAPTPDSTDDGSVTKQNVGEKWTSIKDKTTHQTNSARETVDKSTVSNSNPSRKTDPFNPPAKTNDVNNGSTPNADSPWHEGTADKSTVSNKKPSKVNTYDTSTVKGTDGPRVAFEARLVENKDIKKTAWAVLANGKPLFYVAAGKAFPELTAKPGEKEFPGGPYATYLDAFKAEGYGRTLTAYCNKHGWQKTASMANALINDKVADTLKQADTPPRAEAGDRGVKVTRPGGQEEPPIDNRGEKGPNRTPRQTADIGDKVTPTGSKPVRDAGKGSVPRAAAVTTVFRKAAKPEDDQWIVYIGKKAAFRVKAAQAWPTEKLFQAPKKDEFKGHDFKSYYAAFTSDAYGATLKQYAEAQGWKKAASLCNGDVITKNAQALDSMGGGAGPIPQGPGQPGGLDQQAIPDNMSKDTMTTGGMNPPADVIEQYDADQDSKPAVSDILVDMLAPLIAAGAYSSQEVVTELGDTFADEDAKSSFEGSLSERVQTLMDEDDTAAQDPAAPAGGDPTAPAPEAGATPSGAEVQEMAQQLQATAAQKTYWEKRANKAEEKLKAATTLVHRLAKVANTQTRVRAAQALVSEMQSRVDGAGQLLLPTVDSLTQSGVPSTDAERIVEARRQDEITKLAKMTDAQFAETQGLIKKFAKVDQAEQPAAPSKEHLAAASMPTLFFGQGPLDAGGKFGLSDGMFKASEKAEAHAETKVASTVRRTI
jgi:hypothetical protein